MEISKVKKYAGKEVYLILKNNFNYTCTLPKEIEQDFTILDKYGHSIEINCDFISFIQEVNNKKKQIKPAIATDRPEKIDTFKELRKKATTTTMDRGLR